MSRNSYGTNDGCERHNKVACDLCGQGVIRWVITHLDREGQRVLTGAAQGRNTFATYREADDRLRATTANNSADTLASVYGAQALGTFEVRPCDCWPVHFDPKGVYFEA
jgi:hypothetical protein